MIYRLVEAQEVTYYRSSAPWDVVLGHHSQATDPPDGAHAGDVIDVFTLDGIEEALAERGIDPARVGELPETTRELLAEAEREEDLPTQEFLVGLVSFSREAPRIRVEDLDRGTLFLRSGGAIRHKSDYQSEWIRSRERYSRLGR